MSLSVKERGCHIATFRAVQVYFMEMLASWVPTTAEMEVKLLMGEHIWDCAQHADTLGKRTHELRLPLQHSMAPSAPYDAILKGVRAATATPERVAGFYRCLLPGMSARYRHYLSLTDELMDAPSVRIIERVLADHARMLKQCSAMLRERPELERVDPAWLQSQVQAEAALPAILAAENDASDTSPR
ncbi:MAG: hypothetical protein ACKVQQ_04975 [Burkholderiales bacterium]